MKHKEDGLISFKDFLRIAVGGSIASARTEADRLRFLRQFWADWIEKNRAAHAVDDRFPLVAETAEEMIKRKRVEGFTPEAFSLWRAAFSSWAEGLLSRRAKQAIGTRWKKKEGPNT